MTENKNTVIRIGTIYNLNEKYENNYHFAVLTYDTETEETIVDLRSNWSSSYDRKDIHKHTEPLDVAKEYQA